MRDQFVVYPSLKLTEETSWLQLMKENIISPSGTGRGVSEDTRLQKLNVTTETVVAAEFHPLDGRTIVIVGKGFVNFWQLDSTTLTLSRKTGIFDQRINQSM